MTIAAARWILGLSVLAAVFLIARTDAIEGLLAGALVGFALVALAAPRHLSGPLAACGFVLAGMYALAAASGFQPQLDPEDVVSVSRHGLGYAGAACLVLATAALVARIGLRTSRAA